MLPKKVAVSIKLQKIFIIKNVFAIFRCLTNCKTLFYFQTVECISASHRLLSLKKGINNVKLRGGPECLVITDDFIITVGNFGRQCSPKKTHIPRRRGDMRLVWQHKQAAVFLCADTPQRGGQHNYTGTGPSKPLQGNIRGCCCRLLSRSIEYRDGWESQQ